MTYEEEYNKLFRKYGTRPPMDEVFEIYNQTSLDKQKVIETIDKRISTYSDGGVTVRALNSLKKELIGEDK